MIIDDDREKHEFQEAWLRKRFITGPSLNQHDSKLEK